MARVPTRARQLRYRLAFFVTALVTLALVVTLPFSVKSVVDDVLGPATGRVIPITPREPGRPDTVLADRLRSRDQNYTKLHLAVTSIDEVQLLATLRLSGHHRCAGCAWSRRVLLVALSDDDTEADGLPPSTAIKLAAGDVEISETVQLPLRGHPIHYPFDRYQMVLGIAYQRIYPGGTPQTLSRAQDGDHLFLSLRELLPRNVMKGPFPVDLQRLRSSDDPFDYAEAFAVTFERPPYLRVLAVMLVILIAAAAAYSVFLRPLPDLVVNAGALVLGVWGIRGILTPSNIYYVTAVDLALALVIIFVLGALTIRALMFVHDEAQLALLGRRPPRTGSSGSTRPGPDHRGPHASVHESAEGDSDH
jgi:hypothetical protein